MGMYNCAECDSLVDNDYHPCEPDPRDSRGIDLLCPTCFEQFQCSWCGEPIDPDTAKYGMHNACYLEGKGEHDYEQMRDRRLEEKQ